MACAKCKTENPDGLKFCNECGTPFKTLCASCGFENAPAAKFCGQWGTLVRPLAVVLIPSDPLPKIYVTTVCDKKNS